MKETYDVIILGGGAAGLMCAIEAGKRRRRVLVLEHNDRVGKKILISGGGRCNFTNLYSNPENFISSNPHFSKSALSRFTPADFIRRIEGHSIEYFEKKQGQLFCKTSAKQIVDFLLQECRAARVDIRLSCKIGPIQKAGSHFSTQTSQGSFQSHSLVVATGGPSFPKLGATSLGYQIAGQWGLKVISDHPSLVPLLWKPQDRTLFSQLAGVSLKARVFCRKISFVENILFTHSGLSGPAILQISSYWQKGEPLFLDLFPAQDFSEFLLRQKHRGDKKEFKTLLSRFFPPRFALLWCERLKIPQKPLVEYSDSELKKMAHELHHWEILPEATAGYEKAEVSGGGVDVNELSSKTFESHRTQGLYFIGEVVDVTGQLGGHNFQWAWASGFAAGQSV